MNRTLGLIALSIVSLGSAQATCVVHVDGADDLFKKTTAGFGPANAKILEDLTADVLSERGYQIDSALAEDQAPLTPTHRLKVEYLKGRNHTVVMDLEKIDGTKGPKHKRIILAKKTLPSKMKKDKKQKEVASLFETAEDKYFSALKKLPACK